MTEHAIATEHLSRSFNAIKAVDDLSLSVPAGTVFGFLGANGAGKTTTIHMLLGLLEPTAGGANVLGFDIRTQANSIRARSGSLLEFNGLYERMSAEDNLEFYGRIYHMSRDQRRARSKELLTHLELWDRRHEPVGKWSRGMKQKLAVARTLMHRPALVFLDEPTAGLDPLSSKALNDDLVSLTRREGTTVFLNTHNLADAEKYCDQVGVIRRGKLLAVGNPDELRLKLSGSQVKIFGSGFNPQMLAHLHQQQGIMEVEQSANHLLLRLNGSYEIPSLINVIVQDGGTVEEVRKENGSLEEVFITLMENA